MLEMLPPQVPKDKWVLALLGSSFSQIPGPSRALGFSGNHHLGLGKSGQEGLLLGGRDA